MSQLQQKIDATPTGGVLEIDPTEYEGPIVISRPLTLVGKETGATLWAAVGPVRRIESEGVTLRRLYVEAGNDRTDTTDTFSRCAIHVTESRQVVFEDVVVSGTFLGLPGEEGEWQYPNPVVCGALNPASQNDHTLELTVPVTCSVLCGKKT